tara:strand:- start:5917 stop:7221 length:1305 start_codon:yes stop_codon:yes gene_type:complete
MEAELLSFINCLKKYKLSEVSPESLEDAWYCVLHSKPAKRTQKRTFQCSFNIHPIGKAFVHLRNASPPHVKSAISAALKYTKQWWSKSTDTYLFPAFAITVFLYGIPDNGFKPIPDTLPEHVMKVYHEVYNWEGPDIFTKYTVCSDQHTVLGASNGVGRKSPYGRPLFALWNSAVRPYVKGHETIFSDYIKFNIPALPLEYVEKHTKSLVDFGNGDIDEKALWASTIDVLKNGLHLMTPPPCTHWVEKPPRAKYDDSVLHPHPKARYNFRHSALENGWPIDTMVSGIQKMIRRSKLKEALWITCRLLSFALFHVEANGMWSIHSGAQGKVTNLMNRLLIIKAEDCFPDACLFINVSKHIENARKVLLDLKDGQPKELYMERFEIITTYIVAVVAVLVSAPKGRLVDTRPRMFGKYYKKAEGSLEIVSKKRKSVC